MGTSRKYIQRVGIKKNYNERNYFKKNDQFGCAARALTF